MGRIADAVGAVRTLFLGQQQRDPAGTAETVIPSRSVAATGAVVVDHETSLRQSGVWAALRLRANLVSSLPVDVYSLSGGIRVERPKPPVLVTPDGEQDIAEWLWSTQFDLDRYGNVFALITARDGLGYPARLELVPTLEVTVRTRDRKITSYRVGSRTYAPGDVWHERQYRLAGLPVGVNVIGMAAWTIGSYLSAQKFALDFYGSGGMPAGVLKNTELEVTDAADIDAAKAQFKAAVANRDIFVTGRDWEWTPAQSELAATAYVNEMQWGTLDIARWFDVPGDLIGAVMSGTSVTYANITQRQTELLVNHLGPTIARRERALSRLTPQPRFVKLNSDALLRMDPETRTKVILAKVAGRILAPSEARALDDLAPFTPEQVQELLTLLPTKVEQPPQEVKA